MWSFHGILSISNWFEGGFCMHLHCTALTLATPGWMCCYRRAGTSWLCMLTLVASCRTHSLGIFWHYVNTVVYWTCLCHWLVHRICMLLPGPWSKTSRVWLWRLAEEWRPTPCLSTSPHTWTSSPWAAWPKGAPSPTSPSRWNAPTPRQGIEAGAQWIGQKGKCLTDSLLFTGNCWVYHLILI